MIATPQETNQVLGENNHIRSDKNVSEEDTSTSTKHLTHKNNKKDKDKSTGKEKRRVRKKNPVPRKKTSKKTEGVKELQKAVQKNEGEDEKTLAKDQGNKSPRQNKKQQGVRKNTAQTEAKEETMPHTNKQSPEEEKNRMHSCLEEINSTEELVSILEDIKKNNKKAFFKVYSPECIHCQHLAPFIDTYCAISKQRQVPIDFYAINYPKAPQTALKLVTEVGKDPREIGLPFVTGVKGENGELKVLDQWNNMGIGLDSDAKNAIVDLVIQSQEEKARNSMMRLITDIVSRNFNVTEENHEEMTRLVKNGFKYFQWLNLVTQDMLSGNDMMTKEKIIDIVTRQRQGSRQEHHQHAPRRETPTTHEYSDISEITSDITNETNPFRLKKKLRTLITIAKSVENGECGEIGECIDQYKTRKLYSKIKKKYKWALQ